MNDQEYEDWLKSLYPGDKIAKISPFVSHSYEIVTVKYVTKTGQIEIDGLNPDKFIKGKRKYCGTNKYERITPITDEILDTMEREKLQLQISKYERRVEWCSTEQLRTILNCLENPEKPGNPILKQKLKEQQSGDSNVSE